MRMNRARAVVTKKWENYIFYISIKYGEGERIKLLENKK
jgi:hypothetical protein